MAVKARNELGYPIGEDHHNAKLSDSDVHLIRELHEEYGLSFREIAEKFEVAWETVRDIVNYKRRAQIPMEYR